jgi:hypothetical protein
MTRFITTLKTDEQKGGLSDFEDEYTKVGRYHILSRRYIETEVDGEFNVQEFVFSNIALLN